MEEFREQVPLTTYADYAKYLLKRRRNVLPEKPLVWLRTAGEAGKYPVAWIPMSRRLYEELGRVMLGILIFSSCKQRGDITLRENDKCLYALAPIPYFSGISGRRIDEESILDFLPPLDEAEKMPFDERMQQGFNQALFKGMDIFAGMSSVLATAGKSFSRSTININNKNLMSNPKALLRLAKGLTISKLARRPLLPKDLWSLKGVVAGGTDTPVFKNRIKEMWGHYPLDTYGRTEATVVATQTWDHQGMTFIPNLNFFEFIPERDSLIMKEDPSYRPKTLLLEEVRAGEKYELVITNVLGGALVRYRLGDIIKITALRNMELGIDIPQMEFYSGVNDFVKVGDSTRLTENIIWQAIEESGVAYRDWTVVGQARGTPRLQLYLEPEEDGYGREEFIARDIHERLITMNDGYTNLVPSDGRMPLKVTLLPRNTFQDYRLRQSVSGADPAHLRISHVNPGTERSTINKVMPSPSISPAFVRAAHNM